MQRKYIFLVHTEKTPDFDACLENTLYAYAGRMTYTQRIRMMCTWKHRLRLAFQVHVIRHACTLFVYVMRHPYV